jgi:hypothetical protein
MASYERYKEYASAPAADLAAVNGVFPQGQLVVETDTGKMKVGDGTTAYISLPFAPEIPVVTVTGTTYTIQPSDWDKQIETTNGSAVTITINSASIAGVGANSVLAITQAGAGTVSVSGSGVTVRSTAVFAQYVTNGFQLKANDEVWSL